MGFGNIVIIGLLVCLILFSILGSIGDKLLFENLLIFVLLENIGSEDVMIIVEMLLFCNVLVMLLINFI